MDNSEEDIELSESEKLKAIESIESADFFRLFGRITLVLIIFVVFSIIKVSIGENDFYIILVSSLLTFIEIFLLGQVIEDKIPIKHWKSILIFLYFFSGPLCLYLFFYKGLYGIYLLFTNNFYTWNLVFIVFAIILSFYLMSNLLKIEISFKYLIKIKYDLSNS